MEVFVGESPARNKYTYYVSKARKYGFKQITAIFEETASCKKQHEERYKKKSIENINNYLVFSSESDTIWICRNCGHIVIGKKAPEVCISTLILHL